MVKGDNTFNQMMAWENGELSEEEDIALFQKMVDTGEVWHLQGMYGRHAHDLLEAGLIKLPSKKTLKYKTDYYGTPLRTRD